MRMPVCVYFIAQIVLRQLVVGIAISLFNHLMSAKTKLQMEAARFPLGHCHPQLGCVFCFIVNWCGVIRWTSKTVL